MKLLIAVFCLCFPLTAQAASYETMPGSRSLLVILALAIIALYMLRRLRARQRQNSLYRSFLQNPHIQEHEQQFFDLMANLAGRPKKYPDIKQALEEWQEFNRQYPDNIYGTYAASLLGATVVTTGIVESLLNVDEARPFMQQSQDEAARILSDLPPGQRAFLNLALARAYMAMLGIAGQAAQKEAFFAQTSQSMKNALSADLHDYQQANILLSLGQAYQKMAGYKEDKNPYLELAFAYMNMAIALTPRNRPVMMALGNLCAEMAEYNPEEKDKLLALARECRMSRYQQNPEEKAAWLQRLGTMFEGQ